MRAALLALLLAGCVTDDGYEAADQQCGREMVQRVPSDQPLLVKGAYIESCLKRRGYSLR